jgi:hypothetical protein
VVNATDDGLLPFFRESGNWSNSTAVGNIWVNASNNTASLFVYYNGTSAPDLSNGDNVFTFFDDFSNGTSLTAGHWSGATTKASVANGLMNFSTNAAAWSTLNGAVTMLTNQSVVSRAIFYKYTGAQYEGFGKGTAIANADVELLGDGTTGGQPMEVYMSGNYANTTLKNQTWLGVRISINTTDGMAYGDYKTMAGAKTFSPPAYNSGAIINAYSNTGAQSAMAFDWFGFAYMNTTTAFPTYTFTAQQQQAAAGNTCTYVSGNWNALFTDLCNVTTTVNLGTNHLNLTGGNGVFTIKNGGQVICGGVWISPTSLQKGSTLAIETGGKLSLIK